MNDWLIDLLHRSNKITLKKKQKQKQKQKKQEEKKERKPNIFEFKKG